MTYPQAIQYLESFINYEKESAYPYKKSFKLDRIKGLLGLLDNPQEGLNCLHVAGTKGKGSTCAFIAYILRQAGYKVGLYTSPHLVDFRERIRILQSSVVRRPSSVDNEFEGMISKREITRLVEKLKPIIEKYNRLSKYDDLTFFEFYTALAFLYFKEKKVDFAVLETGLGGRLDATNVVNPLVCVITPISYEHTQQLGNTLEKIAREKAGIIKGHQSDGKKDRRPIVISAPQKKEAREVIRDRCKKVGAKLFEVGKDIVYKKTRNGSCLKGLFGEYPNLKIGPLGNHQLDNAAVAVGAVEALRLRNINPVRNTKSIRRENEISNGVNVNIDSVREGLYRTVWPGRCEVISREPLTVLDAAHNAASCKALKETIRENFSAKGGSACGGKYKKLILVLGISQDKDIEGMCNQLRGLADYVVLTRADNSRASYPQALAGYFIGKDTRLTMNVQEAKELSLRLAKKGDLILVTGSLFVVGEFRNGKS